MIMTQIKYSRFVFVLAAVLTAQAFFAVTITNAQTDVTSPGNPVQIVNGMEMEMPVRLLQTKVSEMRLTTQLTNISTFLI
jgi:hypothetical protein